MKMYQSSTAPIKNVNYPLGGRTLVIEFLLLKFFNDLIYIYFLSPVYSYAGFDLHVNYGKYITSVLLTICIGFYLKARVKKPSEFLLTVLAAFIIMPVTSIWALRDQSSIFLLWVLLGFAITVLTTKLPLLRFSPPAHGYQLFLVAAISVSMIYLYFYLTRGGLNYFSIDIGEVYRSRELFEEKILNDGVVYLARWFGKIVVVAGIAVALARKNKTLMFLFFTLGVASFFMTTAREQLVYPFIPIGIYYLCKKGFSASRWMISLYLSLVTVSVIVYIATDNISTLSFSTLRAFFVIGQNHFLYYDFFNINPHLYFSQNLLSWAVEYPYSLPVPELIGEGRYGGQGSFSNAGLYAAGYMQAGILGIMLYSLIAGILLNLIDSFVVNRIPLHIGLSIGFVSIYQLSNIDLLTAMLTHGIGFALVLLYFLGGLSRKNL